MRRSPLGLRPTPVTSRNRACSRQFFSTSWTNSTIGWRPPNGVGSGSGSATRRIRLANPMSCSGFANVSGRRAGCSTPSTDAFHRIDGAANFADLRPARFEGSEPHGNSGVLNLRGVARRGTTRRAPREDAPAEERSLHRAVTVHASPAEPSRLARCIHTVEPGSIGLEHSRLEIGLQPAQRLSVSVQSNLSGRNMPPG